MLKKFILILITAYSTSLFPINGFSEELKQTSSNENIVQLDLPGMSMSYIPVRNQGNVGICYAETAAQLIDAYRFSHGDRNFNSLTSGLQAALSLSDSRNRKKIDGGYVCTAYEHLTQAGSCDIRAVLESKKMNRNRFMAGIAKIHTQYHRFLKENHFDFNEPDSILGDDFDVSHEKKNQKLRDSTHILQQFLASMGFSKNQLPTEVELGFLLAEPNPMILAQGILSPSCGRFSKHRPPSTDRMLKCVTSQVQEVGRARLLKTIEERLGFPNPQPIAIGYCADVLKSGSSYRGIIYTPKGAMCAARSKGGWHASLIIGKRRHPKTKKMQFRIRNSWGPRCKTRKGRPYYSTDWECDQGNIWIDSESLGNSLRGISYLE